MAVYQVPDMCLAMRGTPPTLHIWGREAPQVPIASTLKETTSKEAITEAKGALGYGIAGSQVCLFPLNVAAYSQLQLSLGETGL